MYFTRGWTVAGRRERPSGHEELRPARRRRSASRRSTPSGTYAARRDEDVTRFGEELRQLHFDTLTTALDEAMREDYQRALDAYEQAKARLATASRPPRTSGRHQRRSRTAAIRTPACCAVRDGAPLPDRREPCFFNPAHGPADHDVEWAPPGGVPREYRSASATSSASPPASSRRSGWSALGNRRVALVRRPARPTPRGRRASTATCVDDHRLAADRLTMTLGRLRVTRDGVGVRARPPPGPTPARGTAAG